MKLRKFAKRYRAFLILLAVDILIAFIAPEIGKTSFSNTASYLLEMLSVIPPIFVLLGLLDVWVDRETMMRYLGKGSGIKGGSMAFLLGSAAAGPLYAAFPVATVMLKKGSSIVNVFIFIGAWATTKVPLLTFEVSSLGLEFTALRLIINICGIIAIACIMDRTLSEEDQAEMYKIAENN